MALVRTAICAKLESDPSFHLKIHQNQLIQIKSVHPHVNDEDKKRLADFTVECSDPDFVLIMENLALKKVLNIIAVCNPTATLELNMEIGVSKNQIGCAAPFSACYVQCNSPGRRKNHLRYIPYPHDDAKTIISNTNVANPEIKQEIQIPIAKVSKRRGRPANPAKIVKEEIIKPIEVVTPQPQSLRSFFEKQIQVEPQLYTSPQDHNNTNNTKEDNIHTDNIIVEQVGADVDPAESPSQIGSALPTQSPEISTEPTTNIEPSIVVVEDSTNVSAAPDPGNNDTSFVENTTKENNEQIRPEISENTAFPEKSNNIPQEGVDMTDNIEKVLMEQIQVPEMDLATETEVTQYSTDNTNMDDKNNLTDDSLINQDEMAEIFKEIFPEYYSDTSKPNNEFDEINGMLFTSSDFVVNSTVPMNTEQLGTENTLTPVNSDPAPKPTEVATTVEEITENIFQPEIPVVKPSEEVRPVSAEPEKKSEPVIHEDSQPQKEVQAEQSAIVSHEPEHNMQLEIAKNIHDNDVAHLNTEISAADDKTEDIAVDSGTANELGVAQERVIPQESQVAEKLSPSASTVAQITVNEQVVPVDDQSVIQEEPKIAAESTVPEISVNANEQTEPKVAVQPVEPFPVSMGTEVATNAVVEKEVLVSDTMTRVNFEGATDAPNTTAEHNMELCLARVEENREQVTALAESHPTATSEQRNLEQEDDIPNQVENGQELQRQQQNGTAEPKAVSNVEISAREVNVPANGQNPDQAILVAEEELDLNEIVYDGEIVIGSDEEEKRLGQISAPFIDFFSAETLGNDHREESDTHGSVYNTNSEDHHMTDEGSQVSRKRKRGFSLQGVVFRNVRPKVEHVEVKQEPGTTPEKESLENIRKDSQASPIMRAIFAAKMQKKNNEGNDNNTNVVNRRVTRSTVNARPTVEISAQKGNVNANKRRASSHHEPTIKKERQADDSPRILIYNERTRRTSLPKKEKKERNPKKETKVKSAPRKIRSEEENSKENSNEEKSSVDSNEDSVEYHVDKLSDDEYFVEEIVDKKVEKGKTQYLIKWLGWPHSDNTWTPEEDISPDIIEVYETSPKQRKPGDCNVLVYNLFWKYAFRRHVRYVKEHPEDPNYENCKDVDVSDGLLDKFSMCNCYRELDAGSIYFKKQVARMKREEDEDDVTKETIWMAFCYRLVNRLMTFEGFGRIPTSRQWPQFKKYLVRLRESGGSIFTSKHNVIGFENYFGVMDNLTAKIDTLHGKFERRKASLQQCLEYAQTVPFIGPFFAQQICNDLVEEGIINSSNSWVCLGPGAKAGLRNIYPGIKGSELLDKAKQLQKNQRKAFASLGLEFPFYEGRDLSLIDIEHVLCEFSKYLRMLGKTSSKKHRRAKDKKERIRRIKHNK